jgi:uncharacterized protein (TIGR02996 family)
MLLDDQSFLDAIASDPDENGPRLVYADYLSERGDPESIVRAEFIRVQCALDCMDPVDMSKPLQQREAELLTRNWRQWIRPLCQSLGEPLPAIADGASAQYILRWLVAEDRPRHVIEQARTRGERPYLHSCQFRRGFLAHAALIAKPYRNSHHVARLWERLPLDGLTLIGHSSNELATTLSKIDVRRLRYLEIGDMSDEAVAVLADNRQLHDLRELAFRDIHGDTGVCQILSNCNSIQALRSLVIVGCHVHYSGLIKMLQAKFTQHLERLVLVRCHLQDEAAIQLVREFPIDRRILHLDLSENPISQMGERFLRQRFGDALRSSSSDRNWPVRYFR